MLSPPEMQGTKMSVRRAKELKPDRERSAERFEPFVAASRAGARRIAVS